MTYKQTVTCTTLEDLFQIFVVIGLCPFITILITKHTSFVDPIIIMTSKKHNRKFTRLMSHALNIGWHFTRVAYLCWPPSVGIMQLQSIFTQECTICIFFWCGCNKSPAQFPTQSWKAIVSLHQSKTSIELAVIETCV